VLSVKYDDEEDNDDDEDNDNDDVVATGTVNA
jgi:hypothetical protein